MALFRGIQEYIALDANNITLVFDSGNIVNISGNIFLYPPQGHPILYNYSINICLSELGFLSALMDTAVDSLMRGLYRFCSEVIVYLDDLMDMVVDL